MECLRAAGNHPCYSSTAAKDHARMHLPVAPRCNIKCSYCNRKFDCANESRPGVTSEVLTPAAAREKYEILRKHIKNLSVVGIAGPGDALANWRETRESLQLIREIDPQVLFCLSTNGLMLPDLAPEILELGIRHVTVTVNCLEPEIGAKIYEHVIYRGKTYRGPAGAGILIENQLAGLEHLARRGVLVKVNTVMIEGINDCHLPEVVKRVKEMGAFISNIMPLIPAPGSAFASMAQTSRRELDRMREICQSHLRQMRHCQQCRADAVGLLHEDLSREFSSTAIDPTVTGFPRAEPSGKGRYTIAVASRNGKLIDLHFGHAEEFAIFQGDEKGFVLTGTRKANRYCQGDDLCGERELARETVIDMIGDCDAVLSMRIGYHPKQRLDQRGVLAVETCDTVENGLNYALRELLKREAV
ncbi:MAG: nitrogenase cofactor biosynthesis protein NifB [Firmicutes bacterium]|nr:nitrogenase cofactor biosynthesis protein NifB [Bacillota bacterium]